MLVAWPAGAAEILATDANLLIFATLQRTLAAAVPMYLRLCSCICDCVAMYLQLYAWYLRLSSCICVCVGGNLVFKEALQSFVCFI